MIDNHHLRQTLQTYFREYQPEILDYPESDQVLNAKLAEIEAAIQNRFDDLMNQANPPSSAQALMQAESETLRVMLPVPESKN